MKEGCLGKWFRKFINKSGPPVETARSPYSLLLLFAPFRHKSGGIFLTVMFRCPDLRIIR